MINEELFNEFLENRIELTKKKNINTDRSVKSLRKKLENWYNTGYNIDHILQHAIDVGWRGLFLPQGMTPKQKHQRPAREARDLISGINKEIPQYRSNQAHATAVRETGNALAAAEKAGGARAAIEAMRAITGARKR